MSTGPDSSEQPTKDHNTDNGATEPSEHADPQHEKGAITEPTAGDEAAVAHSRARADPLEVSLRLQEDGRWWSLGLEKERNDLIGQARGRGLMRPEAQAWAYSELNRLYPPLSSGEGAFPETVSADGATGSGTKTPGGWRYETVGGLGDLPNSWGELPANASLQADLGWVQSNRLAMVENTASGATHVHLDAASEPAPSRAALGWLETSIRSYAKYVDVLARCTATAEDEHDQVKRERMALDEIDELLREMEE